MNWDAAGALGEIVGAAGVILTLLYLASQLRQNTKAMRSATLQAYGEVSMQVADTFFDCAQELAKLEAREALTPTELFRLRFMYSKLFSQMETVFLQHREGAVDDEILNARMAGLKKALRQGPYPSQFWHVQRGFDLTPAFVDYVETNLLEDA